jgi:hypothetical protein
MVKQKSACPRPSPGQLLIRHIICPECGSEKGVVAASHYDELMCFCPPCGSVWRWDTPPAQRVSSTVIAVQKPHFLSSVPIRGRREGILHVNTMPVDAFYTTPSV